MLEHHANISFDLSDGAPPEEVRRALATENWDMPVVVTTAVQLFESLYANRSSKCRKLHNLANSVIIFDEAQMLPLPHLRPCVAAMASLAEQFHSTVVLCTATQPSLDDLLRTYAPSCPVTELCPQTAELHDRFRRVKLPTGGNADRRGVGGAAQRAGAGLVYRQQPQSGPDSFCPAAKRGQLSPIHADGAGPAAGAAERNAAETEGGAALPVVSTSLIEAGVDVDFPAVYRELAGLDSVLQAAGRCNREGKRPAEESIVSVFERTELPPLLFRTAVGAAREALAGDRDPGAPETWTVIFAVSGT